MFSAPAVGREVGKNPKLPDKKKKRRTWLEAMQKGAHLQSFVWGRIARRQAGAYCAEGGIKWPSIREKKEQGWGKKGGRLVGSGRRTRRA